MKSFLLLPLLGLVALLSGCAVDAGYVDGGPRRAYYAPTPAYYAPEPAYYGDGGTTVVVEHDRYVDRGRGDRYDVSGRDRYRASHYGHRTHHVDDRRGRPPVTVRGPQFRQAPDGHRDGGRAQANGKRPNKKGNDKHQKHDEN